MSGILGSITGILGSLFGNLIQSWEDLTPQPRNHLSYPKLLSHQNQKIRRKRKAAMRLPMKEEI